jgi:hypothetical protein
LPTFKKRPCIADGGQISSCASWPGLLKTKNRFYSKGSEQCMKRGFFPPGYAELEPSASSSSGASAFFFVPEQAGLLIKLLKFSYIVSCHMTQRKSAELLTRRSRDRAPFIPIFLKKFFFFIKTPATTTNAL